MTTHSYIALDLGAESGRVLLGTLSEGRLALEEMHRFLNGPVAVRGTLRWDVLRIFEEIKMGLRQVASRGIRPEGISCDSWGVDYVLLRGAEPLLTAPFHYRDARTDGRPERAFSRVPAAEIFGETGIQFMALNTLYQLLDDLEKRPEILELADCFLNIGDYFNFLLSGAPRAEASLASTTQLYDPRSHGWSTTLAQRFGLPGSIFPRIVSSGTVLGPLTVEIVGDCGLEGVQVVASLSHDTGAAVAAVPAEGEGWAYLSSGTWSLLGIESARPIITPESLRYNFTNEVGFGGSIRFLKNIVGLWVVQECRREWAREGREYSYDELTSLAAESEPLRSIIDPSDQRFLKPGGMPSKIAAYCRETGQPVPGCPGDFVRCTLESLALLYRVTMDRIEEVTGFRLTRLHVIGGGSRNSLLNTFTAGATGRTVIAGPVECTGAGNILVQAIALGHLPSLASAREVMKRSCELKFFEPSETATWEAALERLHALTSLSRQGNP
jgi:rhamnulokinase